MPAGAPTVETMDRRKSTEKEAKEEEEEETLYDTVGVVTVDSSGNVCAAVSSGGVALKRPGRVGQAAIYGCGCFAASAAANNNACNSSSDGGGGGGSSSGGGGGSSSDGDGDGDGRDSCSRLWTQTQTVGVSTSGVGEELIKTQLASTCSNLLLSESSTMDVRNKECCETRESREEDTAQEGRGAWSVERGPIRLLSSRQQAALVYADNCARFRRRHPHQRQSRRRPAMGF